MKIILSHLLLILALLSQSAAAFWEDDEILPVEQAFVLSTSQEGDTLTLKWSIQDGYYLYKSKIKAHSLTDGVELGQLDLPDGEIKHDEFFGEVEIYHGEISATIPVITRSTNADQFDVNITSQGCAERGICYPPHTEKLSFITPDIVKTENNDPFKQLSTIGNSFGFDDEQEILDPDQAFQHAAFAVDGNTLEARWQIEDGYYLYKDRISFELAENKDASLGTPVLPKGKMKDDPEFGQVETYTGELIIQIPVLRTSSEATQLSLISKYQGCAEIGICYPPQTRTTELNLPAGTVASTIPVPTVTAATTQPVSDVDSFTRTLTEGSLLKVMIAALGFGLLLAFTACMYPMIPILSSIIVGQGEHATVARSLTLTLVYVEALAITFAVIGAIIGTFSDAIGIQALFQKPIFLIPFSILFVVLALGMFGFFNIQMPAAIQSRLNNLSNQQQSGSLIGVFFMGSLSALIIGPCGGPILVAALSYAASAGPIKGALAMFALGNGMGLPLLVVGASGGKLLPKAGDWMNTVKAVAGVILLAVAIAFLSRMPDIFSPMLIMLMWAALFITSGVYMGALEPLPIESTGWYRFWKGLGLMMILYGALVLLGGLSGARDVTNPLHGSRFMAMQNSGIAVAATGENTYDKIAFKRVKTVADLENALAEASAAGKPVMFDFYADWCTYCIQYEEYVFPTMPVREALKDYVLLQADVTATDAEDKALMHHNDVVLPPAILFFDTSGKELRHFRVVGTMKADAFAAHVNRASGG